MINYKRFIIYSVVVMAINNVSAAVLETHKSLGNSPAGAVELKIGIFTSAMLHKPLKFRVFSPIDPHWDPVNKKARQMGMRIVVYVLNLKGMPRVSTVADRKIIEDLLSDNFLVVTVDYQRNKIGSPFEFQKDISRLFCVFGGKAHLKSPFFTSNRKKTMNISDLSNDQFYEKFSYKKSDEVLKIPIDRFGIYIIPSGYTVKAHVVFKKDFTGALLRPVSKKKLKMRPNKKPQTPRKELFMDIIYPKYSKENMKVPIIFEMSPMPEGVSTINLNSPILYSWVFNNYAFASMPFVGATKKGVYPLHYGIRYLRSKKDTYSLNGTVGTAGISKSCSQVYKQSNLKDIEMAVDSEPYGNESSKVSVTMCAVGGYPGYNSLDDDAVPLVFSYCHLNMPMRKMEDDGGKQCRKIKKAYVDAGLADKCLLLDSPLAGHEYDIYNLNRIMKFYDKFCK